MFKVVFTNETEIFVASNTLEDAVLYLKKYDWLAKQANGKRRKLHSITWQSWVEIDRR